uniref:Uncharacterized protein n=1 Tax=Trichuris muris TaxID=70415 RepID=A0A5S6R3S0_TRIMR
MPLLDNDDDDGPPGHASDGCEPAIDSLLLDSVRLSFNAEAPSHNFDVSNKVGGVESARPSKLPFFARSTIGGLVSLLVPLTPSLTGAAWARNELGALAGHRRLIESAALRRLFPRSILRWVQSMVMRRYDALPRCAAFVRASDRSFGLKCISAGERSSRAQVDSASTSKAAFVSQRPRTPPPSVAEYIEAAWTHSAQLVFPRILQGFS